MNEEKAKLILASFRPSGSDLNDSAFAEALTLAAEEKSLGQWLAQERAKDLAFAESLAEFPIPEDLRETLFEVLATTQQAPGYSQLDHDFASALCDIQPPTNLRNDILAAMEVEQKVAAIPVTHEREKPRKALLSLPSIGMAAAAGIVAALVWTIFLKPSNPERYVASMEPIALEVEAINYLSGNISLDREDPEQESLYQFLASNGLPSPDDLPEGLKNATGIGCKRLSFNDKPASLICYRQAPGDPIVHLIVFNKDSVHGELPSIANVSVNDSKAHDGWSVAKWSSEDMCYMLISEMESNKLDTVF